MHNSTETQLQQTQLLTVENKTKQRITFYYKNAITRN